MMHGRLTTWDKTEVYRLTTRGYHSPIHLVLMWKQESWWRQYLPSSTPNRAVLWTSKNPGHTRWPVLMREIAYTERGFYWPEVICLKSLINYTVFISVGASVLVFNSKQWHATGWPLLVPDGYKNSIPCLYRYRAVIISVNRPLTVRIIAFCACWC